MIHFLPSSTNTIHNNATVHPRGSIEEQGSLGGICKTIFTIVEKLFSFHGNLVTNRTLGCTGIEPPHNRQCLQGKGKTKSQFNIVLVVDSLVIELSVSGYPSLFICLIYMYS